MAIGNFPFFMYTHKLDCNARCMGEGNLTYFFLASFVLIAGYVLGCWLVNSIFLLIQRY